MPGSTPPFALSLSKGPRAVRPSTLLRMNGCGKHPPFALSLSKGPRTVRPSTLLRMNGCREAPPRSP